MNKTFSVLLSLLILLSSLNFKLNAHYCGQRLVDIALFGEAEACPMSFESASSSKEAPCCKNRDILIEGEDYLSSKSFDKQKVNNFEFLLVDLQYPLELLSIQANAVHFVEQYIPPLIEQDILLVVQSFLI